MKIRELENKQKHLDEHEKLRLRRLQENELLSQRIKHLRIMEDRVLGMLLLELKIGLETSVTEDSTYAHARGKKTSAAIDHQLNERTQIGRSLIVALTTNIKDLVRTGMCDVNRSYAILKRYQASFPTVDEQPIYLTNIQFTLAKNYHLEKDDRAVKTERKHTYTQWANHQPQAIFKTLDHFKTVILPTVNEPNDPRKAKANLIKSISSFSNLVVNHLEAKPTVTGQEILATPVIKSSLNEVYAAIPTDFRNMQAGFRNDELTSVNTMISQLEPLISAQVTTKMPLVAALQDYVSMRTQTAQEQATKKKQEFNSSYLFKSFNSFFGEFSAGVKIQAAKKMIKLILLDENDPARKLIHFSTHEMEALRDQRLGKIINQHEHLLPKEFAVEDQVRNLHHFRILGI